MVAADDGPPDARVGDAGHADGPRARGDGETAGGYLLAGKSLLWLHFASLGYVVHWLGDSLDGTLARVRDIRREKYGFFVDHQADAVSATIIFVGLGLGPLMRVEFALAILTGFLLMMNLVNMVEIARGVFKISFWGGGPTELRIVMILVNTAIWALGNPTRTLFGMEWTAFDLFALGAIPFVYVLYLSSAARETLLISKLDPRPEPGQGRDGVTNRPPSGGGVRSQRVIMGREGSRWRPPRFPQASRPQVFPRPGRGTSRASGRCPSASRGRSP